MLSSRNSITQYQHFGSSEMIVEVDFPASSSTDDSRFLSTIVGKTIEEEINSFCYAVAHPWTELVN